MTDKRHICDVGGGKYHHILYLIVRVYMSSMWKTLLKRTRRYGYFDGDENVQVELDAVYVEKNGKQAVTRINSIAQKKRGSQSAVE